MVAVLVVALVGATGAVAADLITGKDIKNGSIAAKDLKKKLRKKINKAGSAGTQGQQGQPGQPGANGAAGADGLDSGDPRVVTADDLRGWQLLPRGTNPDPSDNGVVGFALGPATPPLGTGSLRMRTDNGKNVSAVVPLREGNDLPRLEELTTATYSSYVDAQPQPQLDVNLKIVVTGADACASGGAPGCTPTPSGFTTFVFDPSNNRDQNPDATDTWQRWDAAEGRFYSTRPLSDGDCQNTVDPATGACTIEDFLSAPGNRDAVVNQVRLEIGQNSGGGWSGFDGYVDDTRLGFDGDFIRYDLGA